ncbi:DUF4386 domain-containing protein [Dyella lipolytica]|uniref:DUF4386 domain-containing protein n=1 Tax=Dyella lipolytica TaxID=1867835 RepID=A0ABW8IUP7_9GAMM|nr:DUF4386 domain-containing protein [Dyella lipolytica]GLQ46489.1 DUF4386 domain-containing protein [Dyella lipolytica]
MAGVLMLVSMLAGIFGEMYVPSKLIVSSDATATAGNIASFHMLFRLGFASYLVEALCDVGLTLIFYVLLKPVQKNIALLAVLFGIISTALYGVAELFYIAAPLVLANHDYLKVFSPDQLNALALLSLQLYAYGAEIFMVFYGTAAVLRGYLIFRSGYLPRTLGVLWVLAGFGFIAKNFLLVLGPSYASDLLLLPMLIAGLSLMTWLLVKGVDVARWEERKELTLGFEKAT